MRIKGKTGSEKMAIKNSSNLGNLYESSEVRL